MARIAPRYLGTETEFGISCPSNPALSPIVTSTHAVVAYAAFHTSARSRWDFSEEHPLRDSRGFDLKRYNTVPVVDPNAIGVANVVCSNGARFYVDHAHPEYSSPECADAWEAMTYDAAGLLIAQQSLDAIAELATQDSTVLAGHEPCPPLKMYKNNVDGKGASYGSHENYLFSRETDFDAIAQGLIPFLCARQVVTGAGRVGLGADGEGSGFQISQRADYIEQEISLETTLNRGIINTRDEPHAEQNRYGRLHLIIGDANMSQTSNLLKLGMTSAVLDAIEEGVDFSDLRLANAVQEVKNISRDPSLQHKVVLADGRQLTALELLAIYRQRVSPFLAMTETGQRVAALWDEVTEALREGPLAAAHLLDWAAKYQLIQGFVRRGVALDDPKLALIDLQYCDIDAHKGLYFALLNAGRMRQLVDTSDLAQAALNPPLGSRAYFRGRVVERFGESVVAASWQSVTLRAQQGFALFHLDEVDSLTGEAVRSAIESAHDVDSLVQSLTALGLAPEYRKTH